ncbi:hypothetical protein QFZ51_003465 [Chitinophaga sp. W3I9]|uniref:hypothetical protein n=1 Tax=unclassified Chitinophaga TaxID=2619133 RepID=UPI003D237E46
MKIKDSGAGKLVILSTAFDTRSKMLYLFYFIVLFTLGTFMLRVVLTNSDKIVALIVGGLFMLLTYAGAYQFANKIVMTEQILVTRESLHLIRKGIFRSAIQVFDIQKISSFRHLAKPTLTRHTLAGGEFDYLGFQTGQQVINDMHGDNQLAFDFEGRTIKFGNNIPSWDFEALESIFLNLTGKDLTVAGKEDDSFSEN